MRLAAAVAIALAAVLANAAPALAGGWAVTILDPLPERVESGHSYVVGYWVLQHGSHPSVIPLGETGLKLVDEKGQVLTFQGVPLREPAHYAAAVAIPNDGAWQLYGLQGVFREYRVGTLNVPGGLTALPTPTPLEIPGHSDHVWGAVHPPQVVAGPHAEIPQPGMAGTHSITGSTSAAPASQVPAAPITVGAALVVLVCLGLVFGGLRRRRAARQAPR